MLESVVAKGITSVADDVARAAVRMDDAVPAGITEVSTMHGWGIWGRREATLTTMAPESASVSTFVQKNRWPLGSQLGRTDSGGLFSSAPSTAEAFRPIDDAWNAAADVVGTRSVPKNWGNFGPDGGEAGGNYRSAFEYLRGEADGSAVMLGPALDDAGRQATDDLTIAVGKYRTSIGLKVPDSGGA